MKIIAMIPARIGSTRLKMKNLALLNGKPLIAYSILAAKQAGVFDRIVINSDSHIFKSIADSYEVEFYKRPVHL
jgi:CMP-N,N'-diacetyllegionaminic acid synthase